MIEDLKRIAVNAYAAGILDGEGCLSIRHDRREGRPEHTYTPRITVTNTNLQVVNWFKENFGGNVCGPYRQKENWKDKYVWILNSPEEVQLFIEKVYKHLIIKRRQAQILLSFINRDWFDKGEQFYMEIGMLNSGGRGLKNGLSKDVRTPTDCTTEELS